MALEAGRQLRRAGKTVKGIILIDSPCPRDHTPLPRLIIEHVLQSSCAKTSGSAIKEKLLDEFERNALLLGSYTPAPGPVDMKVVALHCRDVFDSKRLCDVSYPWLSDPTARTKSLADWRELLDQDIEILDIPGHHFEVFHPKNVRICGLLSYRAMLTECDCSWWKFRPSCGKLVPSSKARIERYMHVSWIM